MDYIFTHLSDIGLVALAVLGAFSAIAKLTPTKTDDKIAGFLYKIVHAVGLTKK